MNPQLPTGGAQAPQKVTGEDIYKMFKSVKDELAFIRERLDALESRPAPAQTSADEIEIVDIVNVIKAYDPKGLPMYHAQGGRYMKHGARIWPEAFEAIRLDPDRLATGPNRVQIKVKIKPSDGKHAPKVVGLAE